MELNLAKCLSCECMPSIIDSNELKLGNPSLDTPWMNEQVQKYNDIGHETKLFSEDAELESKVEKILIAREQSGDSHALFLLGQLYFEQVGMSFV